ncbi:MAG: anaerobic ribonucleoside triphosphate reductase, partial [Methanosphaera sp. rholeuAM270]
ADPESNKLGHKVIDYINNKINTLKSETPYRWSIIQTPAESTAYRFATIDKKMYPKQTICNGENGAYYYTNSNHLPVDTSLSLPEKIKIESEYHPKTGGGHIFHAFMGESYSDPESLRSLTNKICHNSDIGFWAYSSALSYCNKCGTLMKGLQEKCTHCGETREVEWYDRITGYVQQVGHSKSASGGWNAGKKQELIDRRRFEQ